MAEKEYIEREDVLNFLEETRDGLKGTPTFVELLNQCIDALQRRRPSADVAEVVHGEWEDKYHIVPLYGDKQMRGTFKTCSVCRFIVVGESLGPLTYCPNCGARMDGGKEATP